jgi:hypothetical protein
MHSQDPELVNANLDEMRKIGYDTRDIDMSGINKAVLGFFVFTIGCIIIGIGVVAYVGKFGARPDLPQLKAPLAVADAPLLQTNVTAKLDIEVLRRNENERLTTYGWVDKEKGIVRIPVDVAIEKALQKGFPERTGVVESTTADMTAPGSAPVTDSVPAETPGTDEGTVNTGGAERVPSGETAPGSTGEEGKAGG